MVMLIAMKTAALFTLQKSFCPILLSDYSYWLQRDREALHEATQLSAKASPRLPSQHQGLDPPSQLNATVFPAQMKGADLGAPPVLPRSPELLGALSQLRPQPWWS